MLSAGALRHASRREDYHLTCFMSSQPLDPRPDPFDPAGGGLQPDMRGPVRGPLPVLLARELEAFRSIGASTPAMDFEVRFRD